MKLLIAGPRGSHGPLSNEADYGFEIEGEWWRTVDHYVEAQRLCDPSDREDVRVAYSVRDARRIGRDPRRETREDWQDVRDDTMRRALRAKFTEHPDLQKMLLLTGQAELVVRGASGEYWAVNARDEGNNRAGELLMELRERLKGERFRLRVATNATMGDDSKRGEIREVSTDDR